VKRPLLLLITGFLLAVTAASAHAQAGEHVQSLARKPEPFEAQAALADSSSYAFNVMDQNQVGMTISNYSFTGTNFTSSAPSFEYPLGSTHMHMVRGGLWIGGVAFDTTQFIGVSTGAVDGSIGSAGAQATEFTPGTNRIYARSTLSNSRVYAPGAVSELDFISLFSDNPAKSRSQTGGAFPHRPLGLAITQYNYEWSFSDYAHICFFHYVIKNVSDLAVTDVWVGLYNELASGSMKDVNFNPSGAWFKKKQIGWVDSLSLFTERYCEYILNPPTFSNCHYFRAPEIVGVKLLGLHWGSVQDTAVKQVTMQSWSYSPGSAARDEDTEKYALLSAGTATTVNPIPDSLAPFSGDPVEMIATGPFPRLNPGDSVSVDFAYIGALDLPTLVNRARVAQRAYELDYIVPVPPPSPKVKMVVRNHAVDLYWEGSPEGFLDPTGRTDAERRDFEGYRVYYGEARNDLHRLAQFDLSSPLTYSDTTGFNTGLSAILLPTPVTIDGQTYQYKYTIDNLRDGFKSWAAVTSYDRGTPVIESLESGLSQNEEMFVPAPAPGETSASGVTVFPNPYRVETKWDSGQQARQHFLWFAGLPQQCTLKIYTLSGALVFSTEFDGSKYDGSNANGVYQPLNDLNMNLSGTMFGWDMITREGQAAATGLYIWAVEDKRTGKHQTGKLLLVKSDRESF
jgi:hypothetical protein